MDIKDIIRQALMARYNALEEEKKAIDAELAKLETGDVAVGGVKLHWTQTPEGKKKLKAREAKKKKNKAIKQGPVPTASLKPAHSSDAPLAAGEQTAEELASALD